MSKKIENLADLANQWGKQFSKRNGTTRKWVDLHAKKEDMKKYRKYKIKSKVLKVWYDQNFDKVSLPEQIMTSSFNNDSDGVGTATFNKSKETKTSFTWSITEGLELGLSQEITAGVPEVAQSKTKLSTKISLNSTQEKTKSETNQWEINREISVPAHKSIEITWAIKEAKVTATFYADIEITGYFAIWNNKKVDGHWLWFIPVEDAFREMKKWGIKIPSQFSIKDNSVIYRAKGKCTGQAGLNDVFTVKNSDGGPCWIPGA